MRIFDPTVNEIPTGIDADSMSPADEIIETTS